MNSFPPSGPQRPRPARRGEGVTAVLGPTNTGKTHLAIERMLAHSSGIIGLPLRLLAREVYNKICARIDPSLVALITGEEKIKPAGARYFVSTVEAMPLERDVAFLAIDEIQIAADLERGHVFTDRILNRRGRDETLVLGAATMRPMVEKLLPGAHVLTRPRLSQLTYAGDRKLTRQPRRTAIVAFSADEVYAIAELIRRQHGGAAVVLGALSPRTRNAQVALYQSGDVDYLVATDAVGMGLNLDVDHVAFASDRKFDGFQFRRLNPSEFGQIAGRAGRAMRDGTFGTTGRCEPFEKELVDALQNHVFEPVRQMQWRNSSLDFASVAALQATLDAVPTEEGLTRAPLAEDVRVLDHLAREDEIRALARDKSAVERLWDVCQVPDYRRLSPAAHSELVAALYLQLMRNRHIRPDWFAAQVRETDRTDGDIDTLAQRIAQIRTWTFVANRPDWLSDPDHWQGATRQIEDKLSDALHERLTERFVDRRTSVLMRRLREKTTLDTTIGKTGEVTVEGHVIGRLDGFTFIADAAAGGSEARALQAAAQMALAGEIDARAARLGQAPDEQFVLASDNVLRWLGDAVGRLEAAADPLAPQVRLIADDRLAGAARETVQNRLDLWIKAHIRKILAPLYALTEAEDVTGLARGVAFQLVEALGVMDRQRAASDIKALDQAARAVLRKYGMRFGAYTVYIPALLKPAPRSLALQLWGMSHDAGEAGAVDAVRHFASSGRTSMPADKSVPADTYRVLGYRLAGERAVRVDILERLADLIRPALAWREGAPGPRPPGAFNGFGFVVTQAMMSLVGSSGEDFGALLRSLGYRMEKRPRPPEPPPEAVAASAAETPAEDMPSIAAAAALGEMSDAPADAPVDEATETTGEAEVATAPEPVEAAPEPIETAPEPVADEQPVSEEVVEEATEEAETDSAPAVAADASPDAETAEASADAAATEAASADAKPADDLIEVWRPGRPEGQAPQRRRRPEGRHGQRGAPGAEAGAPADATEKPEERRNRRRFGRDRRPGGDQQNQPAAGQTAEAAPQDQRRDDRKDNRNQERRGDKPDNRDNRRQNRPGQGAQGAQGAQGGPRPDRDDRPPRDGRPPRDRNRGRDRREDGPAQRLYASSAPRRNEGGQPDPDSPFAKLLALKAQMEGGKGGA